ncbi:MAG: phosphoserine phosphatase SerB, partial [Hyphomicrobiales bacterium]|nr:phosphoserine phosphatase SerB [Hyphomicrobiales bacterium]
ESLGTPDDWRCLSPETAYEINFSMPGTTAFEAEDLVRAALGSRQVDVAMVPAENRRKKLLVADMDSTMIEQECIDELADAVGVKEQVSAVTERAMRGEIAFEPAIRERVALLEGLDRTTLQSVMETRISFTPGGKKLVRTMRAHGAKTALVSGGFTLFTGFVAGELAFDSHHANILEFDDEKLAGTVREPILGREAKLETMRRIEGEHGIAPVETLSLGDGANDLAIIEAAGLGVAFRAKPALEAAADVRIRHGDLTSVLYIQGYAESEFAAV